MNKFIQQAFTLIELLVVIAIIGILSGLIVVAMGGMTNSANVAKAQVFSNSLRNALMMNMSGEWKFDGAGLNDGDNATTAYTQDLWGGNNCSIVGSPKVKTGSNCVNGSCLQFNGSSDYLKCGNNYNLQQIANVITISAWIKTSNSGETIIDRYGSADYGPLFTVSSGELYFSAYQSSSSKSMTGTSAGLKVNDNSWHNVVVVANCPGTILTFYKDTAKYEITGRENITWGTTGNLYIGYRNKVGSEGYFNGLLDEVRIYNAVIPTSQIKAQYYAGLNRMFSKGSIGEEEYLSRFRAVDYNFAKD